MSEEILINVTSKEVRVALLENSALQEVFIERTNLQGIVGNIYKGRVSRLVSGMQSAFVDIGLERSAFLHITDLFECAKNTDTTKLDIHSFLRTGQEILVQVYKDALGTKGARLTTQFSIPSRYLVLTPGIPQIVVSQKIIDVTERERLQGLLQSDEVGGYIFRTAAEGVLSEALMADHEFLHRLWGEITLQAKQVKPGNLVYGEIPLALRAVRDLASSRVKKIYVDHEETMKKMREFSARYIPQLEKCIEFYHEKTPIFDMYSVDEEIQKALQRKVHLKSGGYLIIDQTEAMTTIDVNTGSYIGKSNSDQMIFKTNIEAAHAIAKQIKLRNLGGIIIVDFIDMNDTSEREQLLISLIDIVAKDSARVEVSELSSLGLIQMTRKRTRESLEHILCDPCPVCQKNGFIKSIETICYEVFREVRRLDTVYAWPGLLIHASQEVIDGLQGEEMGVLDELKLQIGKPIRLQVEPSYVRGQYSVLPLDSREKD